MQSFVAWMFLVTTMMVGVGVVSSQNYPNKPIRVVATEIGSSNDVPARLIAQALTVSMGQPVVVENRPSGVIPGQIVSQASPDGYTLLVAGGSFTIGSIMQKTPYDPVKDFSPITIVSRQPSVLVVHPLLPVQSVKELIAYAKSRPGELSYASALTGAASHLAGEMFKSMAGVDIVRIPYKGSGVATNDQISGRVQLSFFTATSVMLHVKTGKLRALAVTSAQPSALAPGLPTVAASGLPGYELVQMTGAYAPAKTPDAIIKRLNHEIVRYLHAAETKEKFFNAGTEVVGSSPQELLVTMKSEMAKMGKVINDAGIKPD